MASAHAITDWATEYYCSVDDHELVQELLRLRECQARDKEGGETSPLTYSQRHPEPTLSEARSDNDLPLYVIFYKLRRALEHLGPSYLGLDETDDMLEANQPWKSPLNLQNMADKATAMNIDGSAESPASETSGPLESFLMPADTPSNVAPMSRKRKRKADAGMGPIDLPALIHMLITVEQARRDYLNELTSRKHAQGPVGDQSERWLHHHAKRNTAAEIKFENVLVALKELVMLRAVIDSGITQLSELKSLFSRSGSKRSGLDPDCPHELDYDATQCLAILNLMFPLESLNAGVLGPTGSSKLGRRYAFPLQHVPNPRAQLHQLLCEVEVWTSTEAGQNANGADHTPSNCPGWLESARGFAWGQLRRSCLTYLRDTQNKIATQHQAMNPWVPAVPKADVSREDDAEMSPSMDDLDNIECISLSNDSGAGQDIAGPPAAQENDAILLAVSAQCSRGATVVERIVRHSRLVGSRFSQQAFYNGLL